MDAVSHSAIFAQPRRKLPLSLVWAILIAIGLHVLLAIYLLTQNFARVIPDDPTATPQKPITVTMSPPPQDTKDDQQKPPPQSHPINVHTPTNTTPVDDDLPIIPNKGPIVDTGPGLLNTGPDVVISDSGGGDGGPVYINPRWAQFPDSNTLTEYYPPAAIDANKQGVAEVECEILDTAGHVSCTVVSETPKNYGFGAATVKMVEAKGRVDTAGGTVKPGSKLTVTLKWLLGDA